MQEQERIDGCKERRNGTKLEMQMRWGSLCISSVSHESDHVSFFHDLSGVKARSPIIEVCIEREHTLFSEHVHHLSAHALCGDTEHDSPTNGAHLRSALREDVDALVATYFRARRVKARTDRSPRYAFDR